MTSRKSVSSVGDRYRLPDFSDSGALLVLLVSAVAVAVLFGLASAQGFSQFLTQLGPVLFAILWLALIAAALLYLFDRFGVFGPFGAMICTLAIVNALVLFGSWLLGFHGAVLLGKDSVAAHSPEWYVARNLVISLIASVLVLRYLVLQMRWQAQVLAYSAARFRSLQARIRPHFLFNTLNTIASLIPERPVEAEQATMDLADLLRTGLQDEARHSLADELELVRGYLRIEALRLGDRLQLEWALDENLPLKRPVPALLLQPLVENAIIHGIARLPEGGLLRVRGSLRRMGRVRFVIENPYPEQAPKSSEGSQLALENIRQRLALAFEQGGRLKTEQTDGLFRATLDLPAGE